ncbi:MAG: DNA repair protein RecO [Deltaproteobacteria bacterium]|nr:DNA repair protein RecO [Deltaproteobacteria bacterium]
MEGTLAIVLKVIPRGEDDLLCDFLTEKKGRLWALARSARKSRKRFGSTLTALNIVTVDLVEKANSSLLFLQESNVSLPLTHLQEELERLGCAFYLVEAIRGMTPEHSPEPQKFHLLLESLQKLNRGEGPPDVRKFFERSLLKISGFEPHLSSCLKCGAKEEKRYFVFKEGGVYCHRCLPARERFEVVSKGREERIFTLFLEYCMGKSFKSKVLCPLPAF